MQWFFSSLTIREMPVLKKICCVYSSFKFPLIILKISCLIVETQFLRRGLNQIWLILLILNSSCADPRSESRGMFAETLPGSSKALELQKPPSPKLLIGLLAELEEVDEYKNRDLTNRW